MAEYEEKLFPSTGDVIWIPKDDNGISLINEFIVKNYYKNYSLSLYDSITSKTMEISADISDFVDVVTFVMNVEHSIINFMGVNSISSSYVIGLDFTRGRFEFGIYEYRNKQLKRV